MPPFYRLLRRTPWHSPSMGTGWVQLIGQFASTDSKFAAVHMTVPVVITQLSKNTTITLHQFHIVRQSETGDRKKRQLFESSTTYSHPVQEVNIKHLCADEHGFCTRDAQYRSYRWISGSIRSGDFLSDSLLARVTVAIVSGHNGVIVAKTVVGLVFVT